MYVKRRIFFQLENDQCCANASIAAEMDFSAGLVK